MVKNHIITWRWTKGAAIGVLWVGAEEIWKKEVCFRFLPNIWFASNLFMKQKFVLCFFLHLYNEKTFISTPPKKMFTLRKSWKHVCFCGILPPSPLKTNGCCLTIIKNDMGPYSMTDPAYYCGIARYIQIQADWSTTSLA